MVLLSASTEVDDFRDLLSFIRICSIMDPEIFTVKSENEGSKVPVVDENGRLVGLLGRDSLVHGLRVAAPVPAEVELQAVAA